VTVSPRATCRGAAAVRRRQSKRQRRLPPRARGDLEHGACRILGRAGLQQRLPHPPDLPCADLGSSGKAVLVNACVNACVQGL
jgi:hypothetical protein